MRKDIPISLRLKKLFDAVITPTMLYGAGTWAMTKGREAQLRTVQRKMLRSIRSRQSHVKFETTEEYVEWVRAATRKAEAIMSQHNVEDWVKTQRAEQWDWAGKVATCSDKRWSSEAIDWDPPDPRKRGRPRQRWHDAVNDCDHEELQQNARRRLGKFRKRKNKVEGMER